MLVHTLDNRASGILAFLDSYSKLSCTRTPIIVCSFKLRESIFIKLEEERD